MSSENLRQQRALPSVVRAALEKIRMVEDGPALEEELSLFNVFLAGKMKENPEWRLTKEDFDELGEDFLQLNAMARIQDDAVDRLIRHSDLFMSPKDLAFFGKYTYEDTIDAKIKKKCDEFLDRAYEKIEPLWSFSLTLCRELTKGEHPISPVDAWWFGLIDEVLGSPSLTRRTIRETVKGRLVQNISVSDCDRFVDYEKIFGKGRPIEKRSRL
jgi:hypothetical protein